MVLQLKIRVLIAATDRAREVYGEIAGRDLVDRANNFLLKKVAFQTFRDEMYFSSRNLQKLKTVGHLSREESVWYRDFLTQELPEEFPVDKLLSMTREDVDFMVSEYTIWTGFLFA